MVISQTALIVGSLGFLLWIAGMVILFLVHRRFPRKTVDPETATEQELKRHQAKLDKKLRRDIARVARGLRPRIIAGLSGFGFTYIYERRGATATASHVKIRTILFTTEAIYYRIDKTPFRVSFTDLATDEVARNLSLSIGRECRWIMKTSGDAFGLWLQVGLKTGVAAVPTFFPWKSDETPINAMALLPKTKNLTVSMGLGENRKFVYDDFRNFPHIIVCGATGGGKSVFMNQFLCTLITRNTPDNLKILLIDLKGGLEFGRYRKIPHLLKPPVIKPEDVPTALKDIHQEIERRFKLLGGQDFTDVAIWNRKMPGKLPYVVVIFDEIARLMLNPDLKKKTEALVDISAAQGRAAGIHLVLCTQVLTSQVLTTILRGNIPSRVVFATDQTGSMNALGDHSASHIPGGGRMIYRSGNESWQLQAPMITAEQIDAAIEQASATEETGITDTDLFKLAWYNLQGSFSRRDMLEATKAADMKVSAFRLQEVGKAYQYRPDEQGPVINLDDKRLILVKQKDPHKPRLLLELNGHLPTSHEEIANRLAHGSWLTESVGVGSTQNDNEVKPDA